MKPLLFVDFDGTICHDRFWRSVDAAKQPLIQEFFTAERGGIVPYWMRGKHTSEEINAHLAKKIGVPYQLLWETFQTDCRTMNIPRDALEKIASLRKKFIVILATDNMDCFSRFTVPSLRLTDHFDDIVNSADVGMCKNDETGKFFLKIAEKHHSPIHRNVLVDNSQKACRTFEHLGGKSCLVTNEFPATYWFSTYAVTP